MCMAMKVELLLISSGTNPFSIFSCYREILGPCPVLLQMPKRSCCSLLHLHLLCKYRDDEPYRHRIRPDRGSTPRQLSRRLLPGHIQSA